MGAAEQNSGYKAASWRWLLAEGGVSEYYGGYAGGGREYEMLVHLRQCGIDLERSSDVELGVVAQFDGTFSESDRNVEAVKGRAYCLCEEGRDLYDYVEICIKESFTLGEMIAKVLAYEEQ